MEKVEYLCVSFKILELDNGTIFTNCFYIKREEYLASFHFKKMLHNKKNEFFGVSFLDKNFKIIKKIELNKKTRSEIICELDNVASNCNY